MTQQPPASITDSLVLVLSKLNETLSKLTFTPVVPKTRILVKRIIVASGGTPVQFPEGVVIGNDIRLTTRGNTGTVYIGGAPSTVKDGVLRFGIAKDLNVNHKVSDRFELSRLWVDVDTDADAVEVICEVEAD